MEHRSDFEPKTDKRTRRILSLIGLCVVTTGVVGFVRHQSGGGSSDIGPWYTPDLPNTHAIEHTTGPVGTPSSVISARDGIALGPSGMKVRLVSVSKGDSPNTDHWWNASGGPFDGEFSEATQNLSQHEPALDGRYRNLVFEVTAPGHFDADTIGYIPGAAKGGLTDAEKIFHGWDVPGTLRFWQFPIVKSVGVYADDPKADRFEFGVAVGTWKTIGTAPNPLTSAPYLGRTAASGPWGTATVVQALSEAPPGSVTAFSKNPSTITLRLAPAAEPPRDELKLLAFDAAGKPINVQNYLGLAIVQIWDVPKIATFQIQARPYTYLEFGDIHFDPDPSLWKDIVWGPTQPSRKVEVADVKAELLAIASTSPDDPNSKELSQIPHPVFTVDGNLWKDHPHNFDLCGPMTFGTANPMAPARSLQNSFVGFLKLDFSNSGGETSEGHIQVFGSDSDRPGESLHGEWNLSPLQENLPGELHPLQQNYGVNLALSPKAKFAQIKFRIASGPWTEAAKVVPQAADIKPAGPDNRLYSLDVGPEVSVHFKSGAIDRTLSVGRIDLANSQVRAFARLKSGKRLPLKATSYRTYAGNANLNPSFEFDRDATTTEGDVIALTEVAALEVESRAIKTAYLVVKLPNR